MLDAAAGWLARMLSVIRSQLEALTVYHMLDPAAAWLARMLTVVRS